MKQIYLIRHGETDYNRVGIVQGSGVDSELNAGGRAQARAFFEAYRNVGFEVVITSTLKRTHQTVAPFVEELGLRWEQQADLNEINWGDHEGRKGTLDMIARYERMIAAWAANELEAALPNGESAAQLIARTTRFLQHLAQRPERLLLVCSHGRTMRCLLTLLKNEPPALMEKYTHGNTGLYLIQWEGGAFTVKTEDNRDHLAQLQTLIP